MMHWLFVKHEQVKEVHQLSDDDDELAPELAMMTLINNLYQIKQTRNV